MSPKHTHDAGETPGNAPVGNTSADTRIDDLLARFTKVRGLESDRRWAEAALARFVLDDVREDVMVRELEEAAAVVEKAGTRPDKLFGPAADWARSRRDELASAGELVLATEPPLTWRAAPGNALIIAALFSVPLAIVLAFDGLTREYTWTHLLMPLVLGALMSVVATLWSRMIARRSFPVTVATVLVAVVLLSIGAGLLFTGLSGAVVFTGSVAWLLALVAGYLVLGALGFHFLPRDGAVQDAAQQQIPDDGTWALVLGGTLRGRLGYSDERARQIVEEARSHAAASGRPLAEEFGTPEEYAARFPADTRRRDRLYAVLLTGVAAYWVGMLVFEWMSPEESVTWWRIGGAVFFPVLAGWQWRLASRNRADA